MEKNKQPADIDQANNIIELFKQALKFYADESSYTVRTGYIQSILLDNGSQAKFALKTADDLLNINYFDEEMAKEYMLSIDAVDSTTDGMLNLIKVLKKNNDNEVKLLTNENPD